MSKLRFGIAVAVVLALATPGAVMAQKPKKGAAVQDPSVITEESKAKGMAEAPALATEGGLACKITEARLIATDAKKTNYYEVACDQGMGYVVFKPVDAPKPTLATCFEAGKPQADGKDNALKCRLPGNANLDAQLVPYIAKTNRACKVTQTRYIGASATKVFVEVACDTGIGYVLETANPANLASDVRLNHCANFEAGGTVSCTLIDAATQLQIVDKMMAGSGKTCAVANRKYVLSTPTGSNWYEVSCQAGDGYMVEQGANGAFARAVACVDADFVGGGCTLTDSRAAKTEQNELYSSLAGKAGFKCAVSQYGVFNVANKEVVELKCSDRPDGGVAELKGSSGVVYNCALAEVQGYRCSFTKLATDPAAAAPTYAQITKDLKSLKETTCVVSGTRPMDRGTDTVVYMEANCSDGQGSYVIGYNRGSTKPVEVLACSQAKSLGACKLPGN